MGKPKKIHRQPRFQYDRNRSREWKKSKKLPPIECKQIKKAWNSKKSIQQNMRLMGLSMDPNVTLKIPTTKELLTGESSKEKKKEKKVLTTNVVAELEEEAKRAPAKTLQLSEPEVRYCVYMLEKYGDDYKAMAKDRKNYYQDTPKQIKRKIVSFKNTPGQYAAYLKLKDIIQPTDNESTPKKVIVDMAARTRKATRKYIARKRNGHYTSPTASVKTGVSTLHEVPLHKVKRKLHFGRKPPTQRETTCESQKDKRDVSNQSPYRKEKSPKKTQTSSFWKTEVKKRPKKLTKELFDLLDMADHFLYSDKFKSKSVLKHCSGDQYESSYKIHPSPEAMNLVHGRQH